MCELEAELSRLREEAVDQQSLLTTIAQDKETISRCEGGGMTVHLLHVAFVSVTLTVILNLCIPGQYRRTRS